MKGRTLFFLGKSFVYGGIFGSAAYALAHWDNTAKYLGQKLGSIVKYTLNDPSVQSSVANFANETIVNVLRDETTKKQISENLMQLLRDNQDEISERAGDILKNETVRMETFKLASWVVSNLSVSEYIQEQLGALLAVALNLDYTKDQAVSWLETLLKSDSTSQHVRESIKENVLRNDDLKKETASMTSGIISRTLGDRGTIESSKKYILDVIADQKVQQQAGKAIWSSIKSSIPLWSKKS